MQWILIPCALATIAGLALLWPSRPEVPASNGPLERSFGQVVQVTQVTCTEVELDFDKRMPCGTAKVRITDGGGAGKTVEVDLPRGDGAASVSVGDDVTLDYLAPIGGGDATYYISGHQRGQDMLIMVALCAIAVIAFGRLRGVTSLIGLGVSFAVLLLFIIPGILDGHPPLAVAIVGSAAIMFAVLYLTHGFSVHTSVAVLGTLASLVVTGGLAALFSATTSLTGFADENALYVSFLDTEVDLRGLLLAGIIIGALGVLDDVTVTQATAVAELSRTATSRLDLYRSAIRVGRAHVASAVNTIVLAYAGASLPLLILIVASGQDAGYLLTTELLAQEIVRAAVGTIGLVAAVPITTALGALVADLRGRADAREARAEGPRLDGQRADSARPDGPRPDSPPRPYGPGPRPDTRHEQDHRSEARGGR